MNFYKKYIKEPFRLFLKTFRNKKLPLILLIDIIFYAVFYVGFKVFAYFATKTLATLQNLNLAAIQNLNNVDIESANQLMAQLQTFMFSILSSVFLFILFIIVILTLIKGYQWSKITNKKHELFDYVKLLILNIIWFTIWIIIFAIPFFFIPKETYLAKIYYLIPPILYFTLFLYMGYAKTKKIGKALIAPLKEGLLKLHKYVTPIIIITLFFVVPFMILKFFNLSLTLESFNIYTQKINIIILLIVSLIVLAIYKLYFYTIGKED